MDLFLSKKELKRDTEIESTKVGRYCFYSMHILKFYQEIDRTDSQDSAPRKIRGTLLFTITSKSRKENEEHLALSVCSSRGNILSGWGTKASLTKRKTSSTPTPSEEQSQIEPQNFVHLFYACPSLILNCSMSSGNFRVIKCP